MVILKDVLEVVNELQDIVGTSFDPVIKNEASNEIRKQYLSCAKARKLLNEKKEVSFAEITKQIAKTKTFEDIEKELEKNINSFMRFEK